MKERSIVWRRRGAQLAACGWFLLAATSQDGLRAQALAPQQRIPLFNGRNIEAFDTWLADQGLNRDPRRVFTVVDQIDGAPAIRISGDGYGGLLSKQAFKRYKITVEFRWGLITWANRRQAARDSGFLLHCVGEPGNFENTFASPWMRSIEFQIIEGGVGDLLLLYGWDRAGEKLPTTLRMATRKDRDGEAVFDPDASTLEAVTAFRVNWWGRDVDWKDTLGFRGGADVDSPLGHWTLLEAYVFDGDVRFYVNGKLANEGFGSNLTEGKLLFQTEGAEIFFRKIQLDPLHAMPSRAAYTPSKSGP
jgi:hypothetical protein